MTANVEFPGFIAARSILSVGLRPSSSRCSVLTCRDAASIEDSGFELQVLDGALQEGVTRRVKRRAPGL